MFAGALAILRKDLRLRLRDRSVWIFALVVPVALSFVFGQLFATATDSGARQVGVVDEDGGPVARAFVDEVVPGLEEQRVVEVTAYETSADARAAIDAGSISAAWILPAGMSEAMSGGAPGVIEVLANPDHAIARLIAQRVAERFAAEANRVGVAIATIAELQAVEFSQETIDAIRASAVAQRPAAQVVDLVAPDRQLSPSSYLAAGMAVFFLFFTVTFGVTGLLEERQLGTLIRLRAAPIGDAALHIGKAAGSFLLGVASMTVLAVLSATLMDAAWGPIGGVAVLVFAACVAAVGVMTLIGSFARTADQASNLLSIAALVLGLAGGVFFPVGTGALATLTIVSPHGWFLRGLGDLAGNPVWTSVLPAAAALIGFGAVAGGLAALRIRRQAHA